MPPRSPPPPRRSAAGAVDVTVTTAGGTSATSAADLFTYDSVPTVTAITPTSGPLTGGTAVTVTGADFTAGHDRLLRRHRRHLGGLHQRHHPHRHLPAPAAGAVDVTVTTTGGTSATSAADLFTYDAGPSRHLHHPDPGSADRRHRGHRHRGQLHAGSTAVAFGATAATSVAVTSATSLTATSPAATAGAVDVTVTTAGGTSATSAADLFTYDAVPAVTAIAPNAGPAGRRHRGHRDRFGLHRRLDRRLRDHPGHLGHRHQCHHPHRHLARAVPPGPSTSRVTTAGGSATSAADLFTYDAIPTVTAITPTSGPLAGGTVVTVTGADFTAGIDGLLRGHRRPPRSSSPTPTSLTATSPAEAGRRRGRHRHHHRAAPAPPPAADLFTYAAGPAVTSITPTQGPLAGGTAVTVTGAGFMAGATTVAFGATPATSVWSPVPPASPPPPRPSPPGRGRHGDHGRGHQGHLGRRPVHL